ncbi:MAG TPA: hypothetical protein ENN80_00680, partial [Candidatus Hydrogenedentes bacterium]|nr:hypothetical protein [Candidatus Hydrogenedentota bacterium]
MHHYERHTRLWWLKAALWAAGFAALSFLLSHLYAHYVVGDTQLARQDRSFRRCMPQTRLLILGDSHAGSALDPAWLPDAFNVWSPGENYIQHYYRLRAILDDKRSAVRCVIAPLDPHSFTTRRKEAFRHPAYWARYVNYLEVGLR